MPVSAKRKTAKKQNKRAVIQRTSSWNIIREARTFIEMISRSVAGVATIMKDEAELNLTPEQTAACTDAMRQLRAALVFSSNPDVTLLQRAEEIYSKAQGIVQISPYVKERQLYDSVNDIYDVLHKSVEPVITPFAVLCDVLDCLPELSEYHNQLLKNSVDCMNRAQRGAVIIPNINPAALAGG